MKKIVALFVAMALASGVALIFEKKLQAFDAAEFNRCVKHCEDWAANHTTVANAFIKCMEAHCLSYIAAEA